MRLNWESWVSVRQRWSSFTLVYTEKNFLEQETEAKPSVVTVHIGFENCPEILGCHTNRSKKDLVANRILL